MKTRNPIIRRGNSIQYSPGIGKVGSTIMMRNLESDTGCNNKNKHKTRKLSFNRTTDKTRLKVMNIINGFKFDKRNKI